MKLIILLFISFLGRSIGVTDDGCDYLDCEQIFDVGINMISKGFFKEKLPEIRLEKNSSYSYTQVAFYDDSVNDLYYIHFT